MSDPNVVDRCINAEQTLFYQDVFDDTPGAVTMQHRAIEPFSGTIESFYKPSEFGLAWIKIKPAQNWAFPGAVAETVNGKKQYFIYACPGPDINFNSADSLNHAWIKGAAVVVSPWPDCPKEFYSLFFHSTNASFSEPFSQSWSWEQLDAFAQVVANGVDQGSVPVVGTETRRPGLYFQEQASYLYPAYQCHLVSGNTKRESRWTFSVSSTQVLPETTFQKHLSCSYVEFDQPQPLTWDIRIEMLNTPALQPLTPYAQSEWEGVGGWQTDFETRWMQVALTGNVSQVDEAKALEDRIRFSQIGVWGAGRPVMIDAKAPISILDRWHRYPSPFINEDGYLTGVIVGIPPFEGDMPIFEFTAG